MHIFRKLINAIKNLFSSKKSEQSTSAPQELSIGSTRISRKPHWVEYMRGDEIIARVKLRRPSDDELDDFLFAMGSLSSIKDDAQRKAKGEEIRSAFYDSLFLESENLFSEDGSPVTKSNVNEIRRFWKTSIIFREYEYIKFNIKNS